MKRIKEIIFGIITFILVLLLAYNIYNFVNIKILGKDLTTVFGYAVVEVVSGSMEPNIHVGDLIIIDTNETDYKERDVIMFYDKNGAFVTHRIIEINGDMVITQGDNNDTADSEFSVDRIIGKYAARINGGGKLISAFKNPFTMIMIFIIGILVCILISTDKEGNPIIDEEEKEYMEFLKQKEEKSLMVEGKNSNSSLELQKKSSEKPKKTKSGNNKKHSSEEKTKRKKTSKKK